jgi:hypothetical protein
MSFNEAIASTGQSEGPQSADDFESIRFDTALTDTLGQQASSFPNRDL